MSSSGSGVAAAAMSSAQVDRTSNTSKVVKLFEIMAVVVTRPRHQPTHPEVTVASAEEQEESAQRRLGP